MILTIHEIYRIRQRGLRESDVEFIINNGTINGGKAMLTNKDSRKLIRKEKKPLVL